MKVGSRVKFQHQGKNYHGKIVHDHGDGRVNVDINNPFRKTKSYPFTKKKEELTLQEGLISFTQFLDDKEVVYEEFTEKDDRIIDRLADALKKAAPGSLDFYKTLREIIDHCAYAEEDKTIKSELDKAYTAIRNVIAKV